MTAVVRLLKPCDECGGTGYEPIPDEPEFDVDVECPSCVGGWLPDDDTLDAAAKAVAAERLGTHREPRWGDIDYYAPTARAALVAAARQQEVIK